MKTEIKADAASAGAYIATLLNASTSIHYLHFRSRSFSKHETLGDLYESIIGFADTLTEAYQGRHQIILDFPPQSVTTPTDELGFVLKLHQYVINARYSFAPAEETELQNIIDELIGAIDKAAYKIKFLA